MCCFSERKIRSVQYGRVSEDLGVQQQRDGGERRGRDLQVRPAAAAEPLDFLFEFKHLI